jgi:hypothetical protein
MKSLKTKLMSDDLIERLKRVYPTGLVAERNDEALVSDERDDRLSRALQHISGECSLAVSLDPFNKPAYALRLTQKEHPPFEEWIHKNNPEKLAWIEANGQPYPVFHLKVSRVADFFYYFYNHWVPRGDTGYLDADFKRKPNALWVGHHNSIIKTLKQHGFAYCTKELTRQRTPFVLERDYDSIPNDDPRWNNSDFEPPLVPSSIHECLFSY